MRLIIRTAEIHCMGETMHFDLTIIIDAKKGSASFTFKPDPDLIVRYALPELGFEIMTDMKKNIRSMQILIPNDVLAHELRNCFTQYIKDIRFEEL